MFNCALHEAIKIAAKNEKLNEEETKRLLSSIKKS
jgi:hypothetical protein